MLLDDTRFPLVIVREEVETSASIGDQLEALLNRQTHFVLILDHADVDHDEDTPEERREKALMFKRLKDRMRLYCRAMIVIHGRAPVSAPMRLAAAGAGKALGLAVHFEVDEKAATERGLAVLETRAA